MILQHIRRRCSLLLLLAIASTALPDGAWSQTTSAPRRGKPPVATPTSMPTTVSAAPRRGAAVTPSPYKTMKLDNGLEVVVIENHVVPLVTVDIAVRNGSFTEPDEFAGLSHLYEHMFFKANAVIPSQEKFMKRVRSLASPSTAIPSMRSSPTSSRCRRRIWNRG